MYNFNSEEVDAPWKPQFSQHNISRGVKQFGPPMCKDHFIPLCRVSTQHLLLRSVLIQISRGLIKSQLVGEGQLSKIRGFSVNSDTAPPLNIPCPFIYGVVNGPLPMYLYSV